MYSKNHWPDCREKYSKRSPWGGRHVIITWFTPLEVAASQLISTCVVAGHLARGQFWTSPGCLCTSTAVPEVMMGREFYCCGIETSFAIDLLLRAWSEMKTDGPKAGLTLTHEDLGGRGKNLWLRRRKPLWQHSLGLVAGKGWWPVSKGAAWKQDPHHHIYKRRVAHGQPGLCWTKWGLPHVILKY